MGLLHFPPQPCILGLCLLLHLKQLPTFLLCVSLSVDSWRLPRNPEYFLLFHLQVHVNPSQSLLTLEGDDVETFNHAIQHVAYMNSLRFATPGVRPLRLMTTVK